MARAIAFLVLTLASTAALGATSPLDYGGYFYGYTYGYQGAEPYVVYSVPNGRYQSYLFWRPGFAPSYNYPVMALLPLCPLEPRTAAYCCVDTDRVLHNCVPGFGYVLLQQF